MKNPTYKKLEVVETELDDLDKFEFEEHDDLREFFEDSDTKDLLL
ncbi:MAG TPA: hypothetical protein VFW99_01590 [Candidatus Nitrosotalea sp.]|nr:hypothetical protein [Candidatus Nitrosotalea sp.]